MTFGTRYMVSLVIVIGVVATVAIVGIAWLLIRWLA